MFPYVRINDDYDNADKFNNDVYNFTSRLFHTDNTFNNKEHLT